MTNTSHHLSNNVVLFWSINELLCWVGHFFLKIVPGISKCPPHIWKCHNFSKCLSHNLTTQDFPIIHQTFGNTRIFQNFHHTIGNTRIFPNVCHTFGNTRVSPNVHHTSHFRPHHVMHNSSSKGLPGDSKALPAVSKAVPTDQGRPRGLQGPPSRLLGSPNMLCGPPNRLPTGPSSLLRVSHSWLPGPALRSCCPITTKLTKDLYLMKIVRQREPLTLRFAADPEWLPPKLLINAWRHSSAL